MKFIFVIAALLWALLAIAEDKAGYPKEKVAQFVLEKLDVTSLPSVFRPRKEKGKTTFASQKVDEDGAVMPAVE